MRFIARGVGKRLEDRYGIPLRDIVVEQMKRFPVDRQAARELGVGYSTFAYWRCRFGVERDAATSNDSAS